VLGWQPTATMDEGLAETIAWYTAYLHHQPVREPTGAEPR
jgi:dTDP-D-glucose 4,6-dehydratase